MEYSASDTNLEIGHKIPSLTNLKLGKIKKWHEARQQWQNRIPERKFRWPIRTTLMNFEKIRVACNSEEILRPSNALWRFGTYSIFGAICVT